jgi:hypothetical protein
MNPPVVAPALSPQWFGEQMTGASSYLMNVVTTVFSAFMPVIMFIIGVYLVVALKKVLTK